MHHSLLYKTWHRKLNTPSFKIWQKHFWPTIHRCKKCSDIPKVTSGGRAEIENLEVCHFFKCFIFQFCYQRSVLEYHWHCLHLWTISQKASVRFLTDGIHLYQQNYWTKCPKVAHFGLIASIPKLRLALSLLDSLTSHHSYQYITKEATFWSKKYSI